MYIARLLIVSLIILALAFAYTPGTRAQVEHGWESARPTLVAFMDGMYAVVRTLINGDGHDDWIDDSPASPGGDFDRIITMGGALPA